MQIAIIVLHVLLCIFLIVVILLQTGKGGDMGAVFGGSSSSTFGGQGAGTFLSKTTAVVAALFMFTSLSLAILSSRVDDESVISDEVVPMQPVVPLPPTTQPRMEPDPEAMKVTTSPVTKTARPVLPSQIPAGGTTKSPVTKSAPVKTGPAATTETTKPSQAPKKDENTAPAPDTKTP